jgi:ABC-type transporter Mla subunit MlaD
VADIENVRGRLSMKKVGIALGILILIGCATGLIFTYQSLGATQDLLEETKASLNITQLEQQNTARTLEDTRNELQETSANLSETRQALDEQESQTEKYIQLYEISANESKDRQTQLDLLENKLATSTKENQDLQKTLDEVQEKLTLYEDTLGTKVFSDIMPPYRSGNLLSIILINKSTAKNPTWEELLDFLQEDKTDKKLYVTGVYECGNFAKDLHNNAEAKGIRTAFVAIQFYNEISHAINAFKTTDKGLVYIDDTADSEPSPIRNLDRLVEMAKDELYRESFLFPADYYIIQGDRIIKSIEIYW